MKILAFCCSYWHDEAHANKIAGTLLEWRERVQKYFSPFHVFLACGTYSDPQFNPVKGTVVVNSGARYTKPYDVSFWNYSGCAFSAAMWHGISIDGWDMMVNLDTDILVGQVDFDSVLKEFAKRPEILATCQWFGSPDCSFAAYKREAAAIYLHQRRRANLVESSDQPHMFIEDEWRQIYSGKWWNPWPNVQTIREDFGYTGPQFSMEEKLSWPFIRLPSPEVARRYSTERTPLVKALTWQDL